MPYPESGIAFFVFLIYNFSGGGVDLNFIQLSSKEFEAEVLSADKPVLLEFAYDYCSACQEVKELIRNQLKNDRLKLVEIDISDNQDLAQEYNVDRSPTLLLFNKGKLFARHIGYINEKELNELLDNLSLWGRIKNKLKLGR